MQHRRCDVALGNGLEVARRDRRAREHQQALGARRGARQPPRIADEHEHVARPQARHLLADEPVDEAILLAHGGELRVEHREVARGSVAELLHGDDVEAGEVDGLEVRRRRRAQPPRGGEVKAVQPACALRLGSVEQRAQALERLGRIDLAVGGPALLELEGRTIAHQPAVDGVGGPARPPVDDADPQAFLRRDVPEGLHASERRRRGLGARDPDEVGRASERRGERPGLGVEAHGSAQAREAARVGRQDAVGFRSAAGRDRGPHDHRHALGLGAKPRARAFPHERRDRGQLAAKGELLQHLVLEAVDREHADAQPRRDHGEVGRADGGGPREPRRHGEHEREERSRSEHERQHAPAREARRRQVLRSAAQATAPRLRRVTRSGRARGTGTTRPRARATCTATGAPTRCDRHQSAR